MPTDFTTRIRLLRTLCGRCERLFYTKEDQPLFRVFFAVGQFLPWRLMEVHRNASGRWGIVRMHCFSSDVVFQLALTERINWKKQDISLLSQVAASGEGLLSRRPSDLDFLERRRNLRQSLIRTRAERVRDLTLRVRAHAAERP